MLINVSIAQLIVPATDIRAYFHRLQWLNICRLYRISVSQALINTGTNPGMFPNNRHVGYPYNLPILPHPG